MNDSELATARSAGEAVFFLRSLALQRGGVTRAVLARMRMYAQAGIKVRLLLTSHGVREMHIQSRIRKQWELPDSVEIRYFWREAAPGGGGAPPDPLVAAREEPGFTCFTEQTAKGAVVRCYSDGLLAKSKHLNKKGNPVRIEHHDRARRVVSREHFDEEGGLVRSEELNPDTGQVTMQRWFDRSGECWLTNWQTEYGSAGATVRHRPSATAYDTYEQCVAEWVDEILAEAERPVLYSDTRFHDSVLLDMKHPGARKVAVLHNSHTVKPHRAEDATKGNWLPLLTNLDKIDRVVALTHRQRDDIARRYSGANVVVINHPTPKAPEVEDEVTREPGLLVTVTRLEPQKRLEHAIRAFAIASKKVPDARFDIYGTGSEKSKLKALVGELELTGKVRFAGFTDAPLAKFAGATATVLSSWFEGMPLVLNEAMGVGTPFVSYDMNYGPAEVIRHDVDGLLVPVGDIEALADAMVRVLSDPDYAQRLGKCAREVKERFSKERWRTEWIELLERLTEQA